METDLGSFPSFMVVWASMMAAMMLPGALPATVRFVRVNGSALVAPVFAGSYLAVWMVFGLVVYALYRPPGSGVAGGLTIAAGLYELTPLKRACRRGCRHDVRSGLEFGLYCLGSSVGLMLMLVALGVMSMAWMVVVAVLVLVQKLLPPSALVDIPVAVGIIGLGSAMLAT